MKRTSIRKIGVIIAWGALCGACDTMISQKVAFKELEYEKKASLLPPRRKPNCKIDIELEYATVPKETARKINAEIIRHIFHYEGLPLRTVVDSFARHYIRNYREEVMPIYEADREHDPETADWYDYSYTLKGSEKGERRGFVCYELELERYEGSTQSLRNVYALTFDARTGDRVYLKDLFIPGSEAALNALLLEALMQEYGCNTKAELQEQGFLLLTDMYATENFRMGKREMKFIYQPSEIAPSEQEEIIVEVPYTLLTDLFKKEK